MDQPNTPVEPMGDTTGQPVPVTPDPTAVPTGDTGQPVEPTSTPTGDTGQPVEPVAQTENTTPDNGTV